MKPAMQRLRLEWPGARAGVWGRVQTLPRPSDQLKQAAPRLWGRVVSPVRLPATTRSATSRIVKHSCSPSASPRPAFPLNRIHNTLMLTMAPRSHSAQSPTPTVTIRTKCPTTLMDTLSRCVRTLLKMHPHHLIRPIRMIPRPNPSTRRDCGAQILLLSPNFIRHQLPPSWVPCGACMFKAATTQGETVDSQAVHQALGYSNSRPQYRFQRERTRPTQSQVCLSSAPGIASMHFSVVLQHRP